ncbi:hypothetical protein V6N11_059011 [Hibiscus sabdariffa]|uniref:Trehalose-phosphatase n=1 Tax=Hibiscus sabdariffa TaxID=183260 RepID=A0ABR2U659_9ROSI
MVESGKQADFVLCIGDDIYDEEMFEIINGVISTNVLSSNTSIFAYTVGQNQMYAPQGGRGPIPRTCFMVRKCGTHAIRSESDATHTTDFGAAAGGGPVFFACDL